MNNKGPHKGLVQLLFYQVKIYLEDKGLEFKVLLLMDNVGDHVVDLQFDREQIEFLPPNTTSLI